MEGELIAEVLCDAVEEVPWRKVVERMRSTSDIQQPKNALADSGAPSSPNWQEKTGDRLTTPERIPLP